MSLDLLLPVPHMNNIEVRLLMVCLRSYTLGWGGEREEGRGGEGGGGAGKGKWLLFCTISILDVHS